MGSFLKIIPNPPFLKEGALEEEPFQSELETMSVNTYTNSLTVIAIRLYFSMKRFLLLLLLLNLLLQAKTFFFVVDMSASMKRGFLFDSVKDSLIGYINRYTDLGDQIILVGFGSDVRIYEDLEITSNVDKIKLGTKLHKIDAEDRFTWMTKAFALVGNKLRQLNIQKPGVVKDIYILTDGINEPPPDKVDSLPFDQIIRRYVGEYTRKNVFTYYISFGIQPPDEIKQFLESLEIKPIVKPRKAIAIFHPQVKIELTDSVEERLSETIEVTIIARVLEILKAEGKRIVFKLADLPEGSTIGLVEEPVMDIEDVGQIDSIRLIISGITEPGLYNFKLNIAPEDTIVIVEPTTTTIKLNIVKSTPAGPSPQALIIAILVVVIVLLSIVQILSTPKFPEAYLVQLDEDGNKVARFNLRKAQRFGNNRLRISTDIDIPDIPPKTFLLTAEKGEVIMKIVAQGVTAQILTAKLDLTFGETYVLKPDDEFKISGVHLRYEA